MLLPTAMLAMIPVFASPVSNELFVTPVNVLSNANALSHTLIFKLLPNAPGYFAMKAASAAVDDNVKPSWCSWFLIKSECEAVLPFTVVDWFCNTVAFNASAGIALATNNLFP